MTDESRNLVQREANKQRQRQKRLQDKNHDLQEELAELKLQLAAAQSPQSALSSSSRAPRKRKSIDEVSLRTRQRRSKEAMEMMAEVNKQVRNLQQSFLLQTLSAYKGGGEEEEDEISAHDEDAEEDMQEINQQIDEILHLCSDSAVESDIKTSQHQQHEEVDEEKEQGRYNNYKVCRVILLVNLLIVWHT